MDLKNIYKELSTGNFIEVDRTNSRYRYEWDVRIEDRKHIIWNDDYILQAVLVD